MASLAWCELHIVIIDEKVACPAFSVRLHDGQGRVEAYFCLDFLFLFHRRKKKIKIGEISILFHPTSINLLFSLISKQLIYLFFKKKERKKSCRTPRRPISVRQRKNMKQYFMLGACNKHAL